MTAEFKPGMSVKVDGYSGVAWYVIGPHTESRPDIGYLIDEETGEEYEVESWDDPEDVETGEIDVHMVGDDRTFTFDPDYLTPLDCDEFCRSCGQIGCTHNVYC